MTGVEKIIDFIKNNAVSVADEIEAKAKADSDEIIAAAKTEGLKKSEEMLQLSETEVQAYLSRAKSSAKLLEKKMILEAKQQMISEIIGDAKDLLAKLSDAEYFDVIVKMIKRYSLGKQGEVVFSKADRELMPAGFEERINAVLSEKTGAKLSVSDETREITGGFILVYGDIEEDCSFDALFFAERDLLQDKIGKILFE
ncbi:MAG: V-type ATP synthase subunit E [Eubacteriales bacterium]|nr:V-type ATP synthase subunit E [Eubacteriales bacterium]